MRKTITALLFFCAVSGAKAQYFIPVFDSHLTDVTLIYSVFADTVHNYLYVAASHNNRDSSWILAYRGNNFQKVGNTLKNQDAFKYGAALSNGDCLVSTGVTYSDFYTISGLNMNYCFGDVCGVDNTINCATAVGDTMYVGGNFESFMPTPSARDIGGIAPSGTFSMATGVSGSINDIAYFKGDIYACGTFEAINNTNSPAIARWDGSDWLELGGGDIILGGFNDWTTNGGL